MLFKAIKIYVCIYNATLNFSVPFFLSFENENVLQTRKCHKNWLYDTHAWANGKKSKWKLVDFADSIFHQFM